ncbi:probable Translation factor GUF1, mitochondrial [Saccharomycodes ludwigii]|uniref:Probable Translation factor GUF1, mitochondrial n=1 Tax=Saccharomycodes ludwigii TaxID=36035 RepID=A0A376BAZ2_9ASCO|nr:probable Translation factor GUF1, mitochondrial [Saccharomycodes ludwigii]
MPHVILRRSILINIRSKFNLSKNAFNSPCNGTCQFVFQRRFSSSSPNNTNPKEGPKPTQSSKELQERINSIPIENYRNFSIVAHIDHGKSTLSDRILEYTHTITPELEEITPNSINQPILKKRAQVLDKLEVERERGITIKAQTCTMIYNYKNQDYLLHLVDTPGHVDFRMEVCRSYASCSGALLLVDATQGVQAQTVANFYLAYSMGLELIPVINKIDLEGSADIPRSKQQVEEMFELDANRCILVSAKTGQNVQEDLLPAIVERIPPPKGVHPEKSFRCLLVDSWYDNFLGVVLLVYVVDGSIKKNTKIVSAHTGNKYDVKQVGIMHPDMTPQDIIRSGQVGYLVPGMKNSREAFIGDTFWQVGKETEVLPGFEEMKSMVFVGAFPADGVDFKSLDDDINRLVLNDRSVSIQRETSNALGQGWRLGFLGSLHASVFKERLEKEYGSSIIITQPTVPYKVIFKDGTEKIVTNPDDFPDISTRKSRILALMEPYVEVIMTLPQEYLGVVMQLCSNNRGKHLELQYLNSTNQAILKYELPLAHLVDDFFGKLKGVSKGYCSLDYEDRGYKKSDLVKLELLINGNSIDALSAVLHKSQVGHVGKLWVQRFKEFVKSQLYEVVIQARADNKVIARETIKARRKDVLAKLHASDISRRKKLLVRQKEGKKMMKSVGNVQIPQEAYQAFLRKD